MSPLAWPAAALDYLGAQGTRAIALSLFAGLALPQLSALLKPLLPQMVFAFLILGFVRIDAAAARQIVRQPLRITRAATVLIFGLPLAIGLALTLIGRAIIDPGLILGLSLQAAAAPILSTPAIAIILGLDATFGLLALTAIMIALPLTAPILASLVAGSAVPIDRWLLGSNLFVLLGGAALAAALIRSFWGAARVKHYSQRLDGLNVVFLFIFAIAIMDGAPAALIAAPKLFALMTTIAFAIAGLGFAATFYALRRYGKSDAFVTAYAMGHRNAGLMIAATGGILPETTWLYFAIVQFPIYIMPHILKPLARRLTR